MGANFAQDFTESHPTYALTILLASYAQLGVGLPLALAILVIYLQRLAVHHLPPNEVIVSVFLRESHLSRVLVNSIKLLIV